MVGLENYTDFFVSGSYKKVFNATFSYVIINTIIVCSVGLGTALILNMKLKVNSIYRAVLILPWIIPQVVLAIIWRWMLNPKHGIINLTLEGMGIIDAGFSWFSNASWAMVTVIIVTLWKEYPLACLIFLAGLKSIPSDLYEAASIDGAGAFKRFWHITLPGLRHVTEVLVMLLTIWHFTNFTIIWLLTKGGPSDQTATMSIFTYLSAFTFNQLGYGSAIGVISLLITLVFAIVYYVIVIRKRELE